MLRRAARGEVPFKFFHHRAADKPGGIQGTTEDVQQLVLQLLMGGNQIQEGYL